MVDPTVEAAIEYAKNGTIPEFVAAGKRPKKEQAKMCAFLAGAKWQREYIRKVLAEHKINSSIAGEEGLKK